LLFLLSRSEVPKNSLLLLISLPNSPIPNCLKSALEYFLGVSEAICILLLVLEPLFRNFSQPHHEHPHFKVGVLALFEQSELGANSLDWPLLEK
jgi:hypothetical protein